MKKINLTSLIKIFFLNIFLILFLSFKAHAYIGLGPLLPMIGSIIAYIFIAIITIFGFIVYPFRIILKKIKKKNNKDNEIKKN
mgnify:CR=1 FL=1|tara:strand:+ start:1159 stop:1407 length:249 start_codon:yes stop_codon:yes gene_type:complete